MKNNLKESWGGGSSSKAPILNPRTPKKKKKKEKKKRKERPPATRLSPRKKKTLDLSSCHKGFLPTSCSLIQTTRTKGSKHKYITKFYFVWPYLCECFLYEPLLFCTLLMFQSLQS
jgi:hypothetical protein